MSDNSGNIQTPSSRHYIELNVQKVYPTTGSVMNVNTGNVYLNNLGGTSGTLSITDTYSSVPTVWDVWIYAECEDLPSTTTAWNTWYWQITVY
jgi:hypothetical protein